MRRSRISRSRTPLKTYTFYVNVNEGEIESIRARSLKNAKNKFKQYHPEDYNKIETITSENGYEEVR